MTAVDAPPSEAIWCSGLRKRYATRAAVDGISLSVHRGEVVGLLGPNGAGKTTLIKMLLGLVRPDAGEGLLLGRPIADPSARARVGYLPELFRYQPWLTAAEVLALHVRLSGTDVPAAEQHERLALVGLAERAGDRVGGFSKGMQQRLGLAVALVARPELVVLDEPTSALDPVGRVDVRDIVLTHLDFDHAGGLDDFPHARVHVLAEEYRVATAQRSWLDRARFRPPQWSKETRWETYVPRRGESWFGFDCVRELTGLPPEILLVPLVGHTLGHAGVAIDTGDGWLLHAGDAYFYHGEMDLDRYRCTAGLRAYQKLMQKDGWMRWYNLRRLRELVQRHGDQLTVFCAHDSLEFERLEEREKLPEDFPIQPGLVAPVPSLHL